MRLFYILIFFLITENIFSQSSYLPLNNIEISRYESVLYSNPNVHTSIKPYFYRDIKTVIDSFNKIDTLKSIIPAFYFVNVKSKKANIYLTPVVSIGSNFSAKDFYFYSSYGASLNSDFGKDLSININFYRNSYTFSNQTRQFIDSTLIIPHNGTFTYGKNNIYNFLTAIGYVSYSPSKYFNFQLGRDKNFLGDGYRSLQLSDNSNYNPFLKGSVKVWKVKYTIIYSLLKDVNTNIDYHNLDKKYNVVHYLSWNVNKRLNFNLFETVVWNNGDSAYTRGYDVNYLNPIIFFRPVEYSIGSPDNVMMGGGLKIRIFKNTHLYGQFVLDEFKLAEIKAKSGWWANKYGYNFGIKSFNFLNIKNLYFQTEYNYTRPFIYSHTTSLECYGSYSQPLAHPLGANFTEFIALARYNLPKLIIEAKLLNAKYGTDVDSINLGQNIHLPNQTNTNIYGNYTHQGNLHTSLINQIQVSYLLNKDMHFYFNLGIRNYYLVSDEGKQKSTMITLGFKTNLYNYNGFY